MLCSFFLRCRYSPWIVGAGGKAGGGAVKWACGTGKSLTWTRKEKQPSLVSGCVCFHRGSQWMDERAPLVAVPLGERRLLHSTRQWGPGGLFRPKSLEIMGANACSSRWLVMPFPSPVSLAGRGLMLLLHGTGYCPWPRESAPLSVCLGHGPFSFLIKVTHHMELSSRNMLFMALGASQGTAACAAGKCP